MSRLENPSAVARFSDDNVATFPNGGGGALPKITISYINNASNEAYASASLQPVQYGIDGSSEFITIAASATETVTSLYIYSEGSYIVWPQVTINGNEAHVTGSDADNCVVGKAIVITDPSKDASVTLTITA